MTTIIAPSRLHFGLLSLPGPGSHRWPGIDGAVGLPRRRFGGVGLMIDQPMIEVRLEPVAKWSAEGPLAERALSFAMKMAESIEAKERQSFRIVVANTPAEHTGLGVGTQLGLAVAKAIAVETGHPEWTSVELATRIGRGERSAIGIHGFDRGGLIVEAGKLVGEGISPLIGQFRLPAEWSILLFTPCDASPWHGGRERDAISQLEQPEYEIEALCRVILTGMLPALASKDLDAFGEAVYEYNARAGDAFSKVQGGRYASPEVAACIRRLRSRKLKGVGQSSWGPSVFAIVRKQEAESILGEIPELSGIQVGTSTGAMIA